MGHRKHLGEPVISRRERGEQRLGEAIAWLSGRKRHGHLLGGSADLHATRPDRAPGTGSGHQARGEPKAGRPWPGLSACPAHSRMAIVRRSIYLTFTLDWFNLDHLPSYVRGDAPQLGEYAMKGNYSPPCAPPGKGARMSRRRCIPLTTLALVFGSMLAAGSASAAPLSSHATAVHRVTPGGLMVAPAGQSRPAGENGWGWNSVTSSNWSGYAATGGTGAFSSVSASWTEPTGTCTSRRADQYSSFWVGLDGYSSDSVEQTGTDVDCAGRTAEYYGWYEMYPAYPVNFPNTVRPGDHLSASVTFSGSETYTLVLTDSTRGWTQRI